MSDPERPHTGRRYLEAPDSAPPIPDQLWERLNPETVMQVVNARRELERKASESDLDKNTTSNGVYIPQSDRDFWEQIDLDTHGERLSVTKSGRAINNGPTTIPDVGGGPPELGADDHRAPAEVRQDDQDLS